MRPISFHSFIEQMREDIYWVALTVMGLVAFLLLLPLFILSLIEGKIKHEPKR